MFFQLPPAGEPVSLRSTSGSIKQLQQLFTPWMPRFYSSGTAALAAAVRAAADLRNVQAPEVILPAYGCPDLVSAAIFAGVKPVLVDFEPERPWMDPVQLAKCLNPSTVAVVAVSLFGMPERLDALRELIGSLPVTLIEDSAQLFPAGSDENAWKGDVVVLSFGRGKPVTLLGGGAVLCRDTMLGDLFPMPPGDPGDGWAAKQLFMIKASLYNLASQPRLYWILDATPFLRLGETRYHSLTSIGPMDAGRLHLLAGNIEAYRKRHDLVRSWLTKMLTESKREHIHLIDLPKVCGLSTQSRLLRYPLLVAGDQRDQLLHLFNKQGLGATGMYPSALPSISGLEGLLQDQGPFPVAADFARRIMTLPTHSRVRPRDVAAMGRILRDHCR
jgi:dTDP-4-amino-4,6-dideoxygalactose transaminase